MADVSKRGDKYLVRWYGLNKRRRTRTAPTKRIADQLARDVEAAKALGRDWQPSGASEGAHTTVADAARRFVTDRSRHLRPATLTSIAYRLDYFVRWLQETRRDGLVRSLSSATIAAWYDGMDVSESTRQGLIRTVMDFWRWAYDSDELGTITPRPRSFELPSIPHDPAIAPTWAELDEVISDLATPIGRPRHVSLRIAVLLRYTGLRVGQVARLAWEDFDLEAATLTIRGELGKSRQERSGRTIPIAPSLVEAMRAWPAGTGQMFTATAQTGAATRIRDAWRRLADTNRDGGPLVRAAAFEGQTDHAFRKAFVTELRRAGASTDAVEHLVGHSAGIRAHYCDSEALPLREAVALVRPIAYRIRVGSDSR